MEVEKIFWEEFLDFEKDNKVVFRLTQSKNDFSIVNFAIIYLTRLEGVLVEVLRYDGGVDEPLHVHKRYLNKSGSKIYLKQNGLIPRGLATGKC